MAEKREERALASIATRETNSRVATRRPLIFVKNRPPWNVGSVGTIF